MQLIKTSILSGLSTLTKAIAGLVTVKIIALYLGPTGVAKLGQFATLINILAVVAGGGISLGVIKYVAEYASNATKMLEEFIQSSLAYTFLFSLATAILGISLHQQLAQWVIGSPQYGYLFIIVSAVQFFTAANIFIQSILNGYKQIGRMVSINILGSIAGVGLIAIAAIKYHTEGALLALILSQVVIFIISISLVCRQPWFSLLSKLRLNRVYFKNLSQYSLMNIVSALTVPVSQIIVRVNLSHLLGWKAVGYWQAVIKVGDSYLLFVTLALTAYYLPRLSELKNKQSIKKEMWQANYIILPIIAISLICLYFARHIIIDILFTPNFSPAAKLFLYQLLGDFFRIAGWLMTYLLIAKKWTKTYIGTEILLSVTFVILSRYFAHAYGLIGVTYSFAVTYFIYWLVMLIAGKVVLANIPTDKTTQLRD